jgi:hypothetical protein
MVTEKRQRLRLTVFCVIALFMILGPLYRQVLGGEHWFFRPWIMFTETGNDIVLAEFYEISADGKRARLDRFKILGYSDPDRAPRKVREIRNIDELGQVEDILCERLGPNAHIEVTARIAKRQGWQNLHRETLGNICPKTISDSGTGQ